MASTKRTEVELRPPVKALKKQHAAATKAAKDMRSSYARVGVMLDRWVQKNFQSQGGNVGGWAPFAVNKKGIPIVELRDPKRAPAKLLQRTGRLRASFFPFVTKDSAGIGSDLPYAKIHHEGEGAPERQLLPDKGPSKKSVMLEAKEIMSAQFIKALRDTKGIFSFVVPGT